MAIMEEAFKDVYVRDSALKVVETETYIEATVTKNVVNSKNYTARLPKEERLGSRFGSCTCEKPAKDGIPCQHMVILVKSYNGLTRIGIMPYWLTTAHWQAQYPENLYCRTYISMKSVQAMSNPEGDICLCPSWSAASKKGRPKKNERIKSVMDHIKESAKKKQKRRVRYFCKICQKFNHNTQDCWKNPKNQLNTTQGSADVGDGGEGEIGMA
jgi:hypothetical protein